jgi:hypothetical protein
MDWGGELTTRIMIIGELWDGLTGPVRSEGCALCEEQVVPHAALKCDAGMGSTGERKRTRDKREAASHLAW